MFWVQMGIISLLLVVFFKLLLAVFRDFGVKVKHAKYLLFTLFLFLGQPKYWRK